MQDFHPEPFACRAPGHKVVHRTPLIALGPDKEWSMDGFDKLARAGFLIYGIRDKFAGMFLHYRVLPSNRYAAVIGIVFLECVKKLGSTHRFSSLRSLTDTIQKSAFRAQQIMALRFETPCRFTVSFGQSVSFSISINH